MARNRRSRRGTRVDLVAGYGGIVGTVGVAFGLAVALAGPGGAVLGFVSFIIGVAQLVVSYGFWQRERWAWEYGVPLYGAIAAVKIVQFAAPIGGPVVVTGPFDVAVFLYLYTHRRPGQGWRHGFGAR